MAGKIRNRFFTLLGKKEQQLGRRITNTEISKATGISHPAVARWIRNEVTEAEFKVLAAFCEYFDCEIGDLLYIERDTEEQDGK